MTGTPAVTENDALAAALDAVLAGHPAAALERATQRLMAVYRSGEAPGALAVGSETAALAYAAYRMPATYAAVSAALAAARDLDLPRTLLDVGGGTGAAVWAAYAAFPGLESATVLDASADALALGERLARGALPDVTWTRADVTGGAPLPPADLATVAYVLGELPADRRAPLVETVAAAADTVLVVEPGTPAGYARVIEARALLVEHGLTVHAPCPHDRRCPLADVDDWCHFGVRLNRSARHRRAKAAVLGHEDEKFSYVLASRAAPLDRPDRVIRRPEQRKGLVDLTLCTRDDGVRRERVTKRQGATYRAARDAAWHDAWRG